jgi:hypothetical protein
MRPSKLAARRTWCIHQPASSPAAAHTQERAAGAACGCGQSARYARTWLPIPSKTTQAQVQAQYVTHPQQQQPTRSARRFRAAVQACLVLPSEGTPARLITSASAQQGRPNARNTSRCASGGGGGSGRAQEIGAGARSCVMRLLPTPTTAQTSPRPAAHRTARTRNTQPGCNAWLWLRVGGTRARGDGPAVLPKSAPEKASHSQLASMLGRQSAQKAHAACTTTK